MRSAGRVSLGVVVLAAGSIAALAQSVISARSGLIHYIEGQVFLGDQPIESKFGNFPEVKENGRLRTEEGRAEVLLTPGAFLRLAENSSFRMITNRLIDTRLELLSGSAVIEAEDMPKDNNVTVVYKDATVHVSKKGIYRFDCTPGELRVYDGLAEATLHDETVEVKEGHSVSLDTLAMSKFDKNTGDALNRWSARRAEYLAMANVSAANSLRPYDSYNGTSTAGLFNSGWYFNPYFGMYTFVPGMAGSWYSPYGYRYWSPFDVYQAYWPGYYYYPQTYGNYGNGFGGGGVATAYNGIGAKTVPAPSTGRGSGVVGSGSSGSRTIGSGSGGYSGRSGGLSPIAGSSSGGSVSRGGGVSVGGGGGHH